MKEVGTIAAIYATMAKFFRVVLGNPIVPANPFRGPCELNAYVLPLHCNLVVIVAVDRLKGNDCGGV